MTTSNRLLPCPFCGGSAAYQRLRDGSKYGAYECGECGAQGPDVRTGYGPEEEWRDKAIAAWNERSSDTPPAAASVAACEPVAYAAFADNGNIQMWCKAGIDVACVFASTGKKPVPLYAAPPADAEPVAWIYEKYIGPSLTGEHPDGLWSPTRLTDERPHSTDRNVVPLYAAAHGDEAVRKDATEAVMQRACAELPEDWYIEIHLENGSGYATLFNDGIVVDFGQDFESFGAQVEAAIDAAMRAHSDREAQ